MKKMLLDLTLEELKGEVINIGEKPFRAKQLYGWLYANTPFREMSNLSKDFRKKLEDTFTEGYCEIAERLVSSDGTRK